MTSTQPTQPAPAWPTSSPVFDGLRRRTVQRADLTAHSLAVVCPTLSALGLGFGLPYMVGAGAWVSVLLGFGLAYLLARCFGEFASRIRTPGSLYTWVAKGLGPGAGLMVGVALLLGYAAITCFGLTGAARRTEAGVSAMTGTNVPAGADLLVIGAGTLVCVGVMLLGIRWSSRFALGAETLAVGALMVVVAVSTARHGLPTTDVLALDGVDWYAVLLGALAIMGVTVAFESSTTLAVEAEQPYRSVPRSLQDAVLLTGGLFLVTTLVSAAAMADGEVPSQGGRWFAPGHVVSVVDGLVLLVLALSLVACAVCAWTALTRVLLAFAREGLMWSGLGRTNAGGVPYAAMAITTPVVLAPPLVSLLLGERPGWMSMQMLQVGVTVMMVVYGLGAVAVVGFLRSIDELRWPSAAVAVVAAVAVAVMTVLQVHQDMEAGRQRALAALGLVVVVGLLWRWWLARRSALPDVGAHDATQASEVAVDVPPGLARD
jgi:amino acid transporter